MSRTIIKFTSPFNSNAVFDAFGKFMYRENFEFVQKNGEQYWLGHFLNNCLRRELIKHLWPCRLMLFINNNRQQFLISYKLFIGKEYYNGQDKEKGNYCR